MIFIISEPVLSSDKIIPLNSEVRAIYLRCCHILEWDFCLGSSKVMYIQIIVHVYIHTVREKKLNDTF